MKGVQMLSLPGKIEMKKSNKKLLNEEIQRQLKIMAENKPDTPEYKFAFNNYKELHRELIEEKKLASSMKGRIFDALTTTGLMIGSMTYEYWTPITSRWANSFMKPFRHKS